MSCLIWVCIVCKSVYAHLFAVKGQCIVVNSVRHRYLCNNVAFIIYLINIPNISRCIKPILTESNFAIKSQVAIVSFFSSGAEKQRTKYCNTGKGLDKKWENTYNTVKSIFYMVFQGYLVYYHLKKKTCSQESCRVSYR